MINLKYALIVLFLLLISSSMGASATYIVSANVTVTHECYVALTINALSFYPIVGNAIFNYTAQNIGTCALNQIPGNFFLEYQSNSVALISNSFTLTNVGSSVKEYDVPPINSLQVPPGNYTAVISISSSQVSNSVFKNTEFLLPAKITINDLSATSPNIGAPVTFSMKLTNTGELASNDISLDFHIVGPASFNETESVAALSPGQSESVSVQLSNVTATAGSYVVTVNATYVEYGRTFSSPSNNTSYTVLSTLISGGGAPESTSAGGTSPSGGSPSATAVAAPFGVSFTEFPISSSVTSTATSLLNLGFTSTASSPEFVFLTLPSLSARYLRIEASSLYLKPNEISSTSIAFNPNANATPGTYVLPINVTVNAANGANSTKTEYMLFNVQNATNGATVLTQLLLTSNGASESLEINAPQNSSISNATLATILPQGIINNVSQVITSGLPARVQLDPEIIWDIPYIRAGGNAYASFSITNPKSLTPLEHIQNVLTEPSSPQQGSVLRLLNMNVPAMYSNSTSQVSASFLYTGTREQAVRFYMVSQTKGVSIYNFTQVVNASPNQVLEQNFNIRPRDSGTLLLTLDAFTPGANMSYAVPALVLPGQLSLATIMKNAEPGSTISDYLLALIIIGAVAGIIIVYVVIMKPLNKPRYDSERAAKLIRIREQIKRS